MTLLSTRTEQRGMWSVIVARGQLDVATAPQLDQLLAALQVDRAHRVLLDLDGVEFVDALGLGVLLSGLQRAAGREGRFVVASAHPRVRTALAQTRLDRILEVVERSEDITGDAASRWP